jgi:glutaredoxin
MIKKLGFILLILLVAFFSLRYFQSTSTVSVNPPPAATNPSPTQVSCQTQMIIYWGQGCSHCEKVKEYIQQNQIDQKYCLVLKEVFLDQENLNDMKANINNCPEIANSPTVGVPLAYLPNEKKCLSGDQPIIDYLSQQVSK